MIDKIFYEYSESLMKCENKILTLTSKDYHYTKMRTLHNIIDSLHGLDIISSYRYNIWFTKYFYRELHIIDQMLQNEEGH